MSILLELMMLILGVMFMISGKDIWEVLGCFAVAALFNIAFAIGGLKK